MTTSGVARFVGTIGNDHEFFGVIYARDLELYHVDPPLGGYRVIAAAQGMYALRARVLGDPDPPPPEDPVSTTFFGTAGGEGLRIDWAAQLSKVEGRIPVRALADLGYQVWRSDAPTAAAWPDDFRGSR